ncbi:acyl-coenzyme A diphosphatase NUDT19-like [Anopheles bellator]|uniref:acyl-coenzyme A diphosphatase NUDT19-like n=1 Tax=Anopheles bellator TaxID=139047 RepID=UPI002647F3EB|nr:acyl-coenzyme A diphosphatase NUDT19-like [Anopheles bellator]
MLRKFAKYWRDSASLLVLARSKPTASTSEYNYKVLVFKRPAKMSFMPNSIVFPGGAFDKQDDSPDWKTFFSDRGVGPGALGTLSDVRGPRPHIFRTERPEELDRNLSLRLCALREAFEELGLLLVTPEKGGHERTFSQCLASFDVTNWQRRIHDGETTFLKLHTELGTVPDMFHLYEWSCWLTPAMFRKRRFETAFYLALLDTQPEVYPEAHEVVEHFWDTPAALLEAHRREEIWLAPPQCYELTRLSYVRDIDRIARFVATRNGLGSTRLCPVQYNAADGVLFVLPGDDLYPHDYDHITEHADLDRFGAVPLEELRQRGKRLHRVEHRGTHRQSYFLNQPQPDGHLHLAGDNRHLPEVCA